MTAQITNDQGLREALNTLTLSQQRELGGLFVASVGHLSNDPRIGRALEAAADAGTTPQALEESYKSVKAFATQSYTACGSDADWAAQAEHFVAAAAAASLAPEDQTGVKGNNAWKAAMQARMAKNCEMILNDEGGVANEAEKQYQMAQKYLGG
ncbi:MAG: hypothetical protein KZQ85_12530 [Candidatus Thiodiazotropha sp. (ex Myrtea sp. 'scaly one' KF741663)]|nr:hypothetical protein [Candidatus Thiodiazotropha sp. (ex Myrtea sp. 'scaly one' KF741663)]